MSAGRGAELSAGGGAELSALWLADDPERWRALGFSVPDQTCELGGVTLRLGSEGQGIVAWSLMGIEADVDGLSFRPASGATQSATHPNGALGLDHVVVTTPDFDRTAAALEAAQIPLRRVTTGRGDARMGFRRLGPAILELVERPGPGRGPARFWGLVVTVTDLDELAERLAERLGSIHDAVQPGRRIATLDKSAGLGQPVAFMSPEPRG
jgi:hypothetical protein